MGARALTDRLADVFACPGCTATGSRLDDDALVCARGHRFPVRGGVPRFVDTLPEDVGQVQRVFDFEHRRYRDSAYTRFGPHLVDQFLAEVGLPAAFFAGKRTLDAGCGSGRWTYALAELGADVTAVDLTAGGVESAHAELGERPNVTFAQADLFALPFRPDAFDFVLSWGVLHHTPDTRRAFDRLVPLVRPGGTFFVMVYELGSRLRAAGTNVLRHVLRRLPDERRYRACRLLVVRNPWVYRLLTPFFIVSYLGPGATIDERTAQFGLFDAYSPRWNHLHTVEEVQAWFRESGFEEVVAVDAPAVAVRAPNLTTAAWLYLFLVRQQRRYARAGRDRRPPRELVVPSPNGAVLLLRDHALADLRFRVGEVAASQRLEEILPFLDRVAALAPRRVCEIGTSAAGTLYLLTRVAADDAVLVSVDLDIPAHLAAARRRLARKGQRVVSVQGDSHAAETVARVRDALGDRPLDLLFIDGDHSYDGVRRDWELYAPLVRRGGLVGLHDIQEDYATSRGTETAAVSGDVPRFWRELRTRERTEELVADREQDGCGIGLVYV